MGFNLGNYLNDNIFKTDTMHQITSGVGSIFGKGLSFVDAMSNNILNMSKGLTSMLSSPFLMPLLLCGAGIFIAIRLKVI